jgi:hypothetical protein
MFVRHKNVNFHERPKICRNCRFFKIESNFITSDDQIKFSLCTKYAYTNLVDGSITYPFASLTRIYDCKGEWHEQQPAITPYQSISYDADDETDTSTDTSNIP